MAQGVATPSRIGSAEQFVAVPNLTNKRLAVSEVVWVPAATQETIEQTK